jgi:hypothetical protein
VTGEMWECLNHAYSVSSAYFLLDNSLVIVYLSLHVWLALLNAKSSQKFDS